MTFGVRMTLLLVCLASPALAQAPRPLRVRTQVSKGVYYVGQAITLQVSVLAEDERPKIGSPRPKDAEVTALETNLKPVGTSGIGSVVMEQNLYISRFRVVPSRAGVLIIPPVTARLGERSGASASIRLNIQALPIAGRPPEFLGGVGSFQLEADAAPTTVRMGQSLDFRIRATGPAARGMTRGPDLSRLERTLSRVKIDAGPVDVVADPPSRVFRYRLRPMRPGDFTIPPVALAAFDPSVGKYLTKVSPSIPIRVVAVPAFDPATLDFASASPVSPLMSVWVKACGVLAIVLSVLVTVWFLRQRVRARTETERAERRLLKRLARQLDPEAGAAEVGRRIAEGVSAYLALTIARPPGALTPQEARTDFSELTGDADTAERALRLIALCDSAQFAAEEGRAEMLIAAAIPFLNRLETRKKPRGEEKAEGEKPREAVETTMS